MQHANRVRELETEVKSLRGLLALARCEECGDAFGGVDGPLEVTCLEGESLICKRCYKEAWP